MDYAITYLGKTVGTLQIVQQGLYYDCKAACSLQLTEPQRLYAVSGLTSRPVGVLARDGTLHRRISVREAQPLPERVMIGNADGGYVPWCGTVAGEQIGDAYLWQDGTQMRIALPVSDEGEVPLVAYAAQMRQQTVCGRTCLVLPLQDGAPLPLQEDDLLQAEELQEHME